MIVGLDAGNYGSSGASDVRGAVNTVRYDTELGVTGLENFKKAGLRIQLNFSGPYNSGGVCTLNASTWVSETLAFYKANVTPAQTPAIEVLNEPGGSWFWGSGAESSTNAVCYRNLLKKTHEAFHATYGEAAPKILGTLDGPNGLTFGKAWLTSDWASYVDGFIVHPYGGTGSKTSSALGNRALVESAQGDDRRADLHHRGRLADGDGPALHRRQPAVVGVRTGDQHHQLHRLGPQHRLRGRGRLLQLPRLRQQRLVRHRALRRLAQARLRSAAPGRGEIRGLAVQRVGPRASVYSRRPAARGSPLGNRPRHAIHPDPRLGRARRTYGIVRALAAQGPIEIVHGRFGAAEPDRAYDDLEGVRLHPVERPGRSRAPPPT